MKRSKIIILGAAIGLVLLLIPFLKSSWYAWQLYNSSQPLLSATQTYLQNFFLTNKEEGRRQADAFKQQFQISLDQLRNFNKNIQNKPIISKLLGEKKNYLDTAYDLGVIINNITSGQKSYIFLFQNTEELRATGGFMGSYAKLKLDNGRLNDFKIEDIYVPDGQFTWFFEAPAGAKEYLSGGEGLKLRDANWQPDFPTSAQQILSYFAWGKETDIDGVIAINLPIVEQILKLTGPIYIHDYDQTVTSNNFSQVARADRETFFPGSVQKQHFLKVFFDQLLLQVRDLTPDQQKELAHIILTNVREKNMQFFSHDQQAQHIFEKLHMSGDIYRPPQTTYFSMIESNVGINKANQHIDRAVEINIKEKETELKITLVNHNQPPSATSHPIAEADHLGYVNYQRLLFSPQTKITGILVGKKKLSTWDEEIITNSQGQEFKQIGFLVTLKEETSQQIQIKVETPSFITGQQIFLQKQSGIESIPYHLKNSNGESQSLDLRKDTLLDL